MEALIVQLISGAVGGNVAGALLKKHSLGTIGNSLSGIVGGGLGGAILSAVLGGGDVTGSLLDAGIGAIVQQVAGGGIGGGILMVIVSVIRGMLRK